ncbi:Ribonuclease HII [compost metagenome]
MARDRELRVLHERYPQYGFDSHVGYGTPQHLAALAEFGATPHHRRSFAPVREALARLPMFTAMPATAEVIEPVATVSVTAAQ